MLRRIQVAEAQAHRAGMSQIPEVDRFLEVMLCSVYFYSLVYGLLWQGCNLMKSL